MKWRKLVVWAVIDARDNSIYELMYGGVKPRPPKEGERWAKLVEADPRADAVVLAAVKYVNDNTDDTWVSLDLAVARYEKGRK